MTARRTVILLPLFLRFLRLNTHTEKNTKRHIASIAYHHLPYGGTIAEHKPSVKTAATTSHFASLSPCIISENAMSSAEPEQEHAGSGVGRRVYNMIPRLCNAKLNVELPIHRFGYPQQQTAALHTLKPDALRAKQECGFTLSLIHI